MILNGEEDADDDDDSDNDDDGDKDVLYAILHNDC